MTRFVRYLIVVAAGALLALPAGLVRADAKADLRAAFERAVALHDKGQYAEAARYYERALKLAPSVLGPDHKNTAVILNNLANLYQDQGQYAKAEPLYLGALRIYEKIHGEEHSTVAQTLNNLANVYKAQGQYGKAEPLYLRALRIKEKVLGKEHLSVATTLNNLANLYLARGEYGKAEPLYQRALRIKEKVHGNEHPDVAVSLNNLANLYSARGEYGKAEPLLQRALRIRERFLREDHPDIAVSLNNLANLYKDQGQYGKAEPLYQRALGIKEKAFGDEHPSVALSLHNLAVLYDSRGQYDKAEPLYQRALRIKEKVHGKEHPDVALSLNNLAECYRLQEKYDKAEPLYQRALSIYEKALGNEHPGVAVSLNNLALLYWKQGQYGKAEPLYQRALRIKESALGDEHPTVALILNNLALLEGAQEHWEEAAKLLQRQRRAVLRYMTRELPTLSREEQLTFLTTTERRHLDVALSVGLAHRDDPRLAASSTAWLLNSKAVAQDTLARRVRLEQDAEGSERGPLVEEVRTLRRRQAALALAAQPTDPAERRRLHDQLEERLRNLEGRLARAGGINLAADPWVALDAVRNALPEDAVLVEFASIRPVDFRGEKSHLAHYAAWIIRAAGHGDIRILDLGEATAIDAAVRKVRKALADAPAAIDRDGEVTAEKALRGPLSELSNLVLHPLLPHIGKQTRWLLSPEGQLWLAPWGALPLADDRYAAEAHTIRLLVTGRDLVAKAQAVEVNRPLVLADPDFGPIDRSEDSVGSLKALLPPAPPLPGTRREAAAIRPPLTAYAGAPRLVLGKEASKATFRKEAVRPRILILSTHGYFLEEPEHKEPERPLHLDDTSRLLRPKEMPLTANPLLRCGLLLAGANRRDGDANEGVLTGLEVVGTDLRGCELVVLSACETGVGEVRNGEGVAGLRQAFQLAGAKGVLASLWSVDDKATARLMGDFFTALADGKDQPEALRHAQLAEIEARRKRHGAAHPYFWAAFTLTAQGK